MDEMENAILAAINADTLGSDLMTPFTADEIAALVAAAASDAGAAFEAGTVVRLAETRRLEPANFQRLRERLKATKIRVSDLDKALDRHDASRAKATSGGETEGQGRPIAFPEIEPWEMAVDGAALLTEITAQVRRFVMMPAEAATAVALWIVHSHAFMLSRHSPRLVFTSPEKRCGKTTALRVVQTMVPRPLGAANMTSAAMFRTIEKYRPTLLIDEADAFLKDNEELRGIVNSGHECDGQVIRLVGEDFEPRGFATYSPTAIAAIGGLPGTIEDRALMIVMRRRHSSEKIERFRGDSRTLADHARKAARWVTDHDGELQEADPEMPEALNDRDCDNWRQLFAIADIVGGGWGERARAAALFLTNQAGVREENSARIMLLEDLREIFADPKRAMRPDAGRLSSTDLVSALMLIPDRPWATWSRGRPITTVNVARLLRGFGIVPNTIKLADGRQPNGYKAAQFEDAFARYVIPAQANPFQGSPPSPTSIKQGVSGDFQGSPQGGGGELSNRHVSSEKQGVGEAGEPSTAKSKGKDMGDDNPWAIFGSGDDDDSSDSSFLQ